MTCVAAEAATSNAHTPQNSAIPLTLCGGDFAGTANAPVPSAVMLSAARLARSWATYNFARDAPGHPRMRSQHDQETILRIRSTRAGAWAVWNGTAQPLASFLERDDALVYAIELAKSHRQARVELYSPEGQLVSSDYYYRRLAS